MKCVFRVIFLCLIVFLARPFTFAQEGPSVPSGAQRLLESLSASHVTALLHASDDTVWVGMEEDALYRIRDGQSSREVLPDAYCYALAEDKDGRIWAGTGRNGVAVWDGTVWVTIGPEKGIGLHVYSLLAASDGSVWVGTECGASRVSADGVIANFQDTDGLPCNEVIDIAEDLRGNIWFGGAIGGISRFRSSGGRIERVRLDALASDQVNDLAVDSQNRLWIASHGGLTAIRPETGQVLKTLRARKSGARTGAGDNILPEAYITAVCEKSTGEMFIGTRRQGLWVLESQTWSVREFGMPNSKADFVKVLSRTRDTGHLVGYYGQGTYLLPGKEKPSASLRSPKPLPVLRYAGPSLRVARFQRVLASIQKTAVPTTNAEDDVVGATAVYLGEDWTTIGNWIGQYGEYAYRLCAMNPPFDFTGGPGEVYMAFNGEIGEHIRTFPLKTEETREQFLGGKPIAAGRTIEDGLRYWIHWLQTDNPKCLQIPTKFGGNGAPSFGGKGRRQAEWDDHGEAYPFDWDGPHVYCHFWLNEHKQDEDRRPLPRDGVFVLSLYFMNKDGHDGNNRFRDYVITIKPLVLEYPTDEAPKGWEKQFDAQKVLAETRIHDFRGGVYKQFLIREGRYTIKISRNGSFNTILSAIFLDKAAGPSGFGAGDPKPTFRPEHWSRTTRPKGGK